MPEETKTAQVNLRLQPSLKAAAEKAAAADHRSLTSLIEKLLSDHCKKHTSAAERRSARMKSTAKAADLAGFEIDRMDDQSATGEERASRKRRLISGPKEFRDMRGRRSTKPKS